MGWRHKLAIALSVLIGVLGLTLTGVWLYWSLVDYAALNASWTRLMALSHTPGVSTQRLMVAIADQGAHRQNMVAEIVGMMIGALIAAVGGLGLVVCLARGTGAVVADVGSPTDSDGRAVIARTTARP